VIFDRAREAAGVKKSPAIRYMNDERTVGSIVERIGFARVETPPKSTAATIADR
jgi:hypothetical protein